MSDTTTTPEQEAFMMVGFLASELEAAINSMEEMIVYVSDYFRHKWNLDADIVRARDAVRSYQAFRDRQNTPTGLPEALESIAAVKSAVQTVFGTMPPPPGGRRGHEPSCEALYGDYHCTCQ